ncbi:nuclear receptor co-repressor HDAC3 complex subunit TBLR1 [Fusarium tjaetaba]|uniref:Nuclear receptor co-repressor HDAC3 complex subunit TBLR1 n=1 Tax=Fusarium tjaetaba TaxID=1567544 RepID=A0A8H5VX61_9HYPO|nr:nuclear receptor co-repressor HDAC3 complex subunit TBLR1 [Fusarium tjaetaba]KAF5638821.1 nuclear receptor co-repressor HDAC3 complex subunit TBLR1 [Fusarium tjaetaba]
MVAKEFLDSDRVNFLVWRFVTTSRTRLTITAPSRLLALTLSPYLWTFLLTMNFCAPTDFFLKAVYYRETAAKFQKEWHVKQPHREFAFAPHVKSHALVSVINRGLVYHALEREHLRKLLPQDAAADAADSLRMGIFGPLDAHSQGRIDADEEEDAEGEDIIEEEVSRKRAPQQLSNVSPAKRQRLSNGLENGADASATATVPASASAPTATTATGTDPNVAAPAPVTTPMEIDNHPDNHAYPSPLEGEQAPEPMVRTDGPEQGTQVDKVEELAPETTFIRLVYDGQNQIQGDRGATPSPSSPSGQDNAPILLRCEWNPRDPSILAAGGTDALARVWTVPRAGPIEPGQDHVSLQGHSLIDRDVPRDTITTAMSWTSDGAAIAVATDSRNHASINVWSAEGAHLQSMELSEPPIIKMLWNPNNTALLAISPDKGGTLITVHYPPAGNSLSYVLPDHNIDATPFDAAWTGEAEFLLCGGDLMLCLQCTDTTIVQARKFETKEDDIFSQVLFDGRSRLAATSSDKGTLDLWDESGHRRSISAHQGTITAMQWQPLPENQPGPDDERLIATGGDDCAILIWNARMPESKPKCFLTMDSPIMRLAFTPDGAFIAGATATQILIWKVGSYAVPRASWSRPVHPGWLSPKASAETDEEDEHCLCWDAEGHKLAYGSNSRLAIINFRR